MEDDEIQNARWPAVSLATSRLLIHDLAQILFGVQEDRGQFVRERTDEDLGGWPLK